MRRAASTLCLLACSALPMGCTLVDDTLAGIGRTIGVGSGAPLTITSSTKNTLMSPTLQTRVFMSGDANTANVYLSDLSVDQLANALEQGGAGVSGNLIHVHMFLMPKAGETPVEFTAANATIRHYVIADGAVGVYSGGGFFLPTAAPNGDTISARLGGTTLRLAEQSGPFVDQLEVSQLKGGVFAKRDPKAVAAIESRLPMLIGG